ncbi:MAG: FecR domain-containing protein [Bacteroidetes bacterium]|nr:FecR domain-containing protein [Bacteroidota bacterium]
MDKLINHTELFTKYINNQCSPQEVSFLLAYFNEESNEDIVREMIFRQLEQLTESDIDVEPHLKAAFVIIDTHIQNSKKTIKKGIQVTLFGKKLLRIAAIFILFLIGAGGFYFYPINKVNNIQTESLAYTKYLLLPDGSKVIVHNNSKLEYPSAFNGKTREVTLTGEAYFDIKHDDNKPFIIHTGKLTTTVLGTAFNIQAYPGAKNIIVTVTRGKVRVEFNHKVLAVLTPDGQLVYDLPKADAKNKTVVAQEIIKWTNSDMDFEDVPFETIVEQISKRYQADISFANNEIKKCPVHATFSGTETIEEIITKLCLARNATYKKTDDNKFIILGKGCTE